MRGNDVENFARNYEVSADQIYKTVRICFESSPPVGLFLRDEIFRLSLVSDVGAENNICEKVSPAPAYNLPPL